MWKVLWVGVFAAVAGVALLATAGGAAQEGKKFCFDLKGAAAGIGLSRAAFSVDGFVRATDIAKGQSAKATLEAWKAEFDKVAGNESEAVVQDEAGRWVWCVTKVGGAAPTRGGMIDGAGFEAASVKRVLPPPPAPVPPARGEIKKVDEPPAGDGAVTEIISMELTGGGQVIIPIGPLPTQNKSADELNEQITGRLGQEGFRTVQQSAEFPVGVRPAIILVDHPLGAIVSIEVSNTDTGLTEWGVGLVEGPVGGTTEILVDSSGSPARASEGGGAASFPFPAIAGTAAAAGALALVAGGWYARRRFSKG